LWDFWTIRDGADYHLFYLQAPRALGDPELRHWNVSIGHAVSADLRSWQVLPDALRPGPTGAWDDYTTWTGSVFRDDDRWAMLYTGTSRSERGLVQRIGLAISDDLLAWRRHPGNPVLEADHGLYEGLDLEHWHEEAWRDPWVIRDDDTGVLYALVTARAASGEASGRGVIGLAQAASPERWEVLGPIVRPGPYGHMEIPQVARIGDRWCLLFSAPAIHDVPGRDPDDPRGFGGSHFLLADAPLGPYDWSTHGVLLADRADSWYGAKLIEGPDGSLACLTWLHRAPDGAFVGELSDPFEVSVGSAGPGIVRP
jgi:beta-fructofuranosidase